MASSIAKAREDDEIKYAPKALGSFARGKNNLQEWIMLGGSSPPAKGRYHLFVNYGCGWCHQVMITRALKGLQDVISMSHTGLKRVGKMGTESYKGWYVPEDPTGNGFENASDIYNSNQGYGDKQLTTPILFDKELKRVISNDPAQMMLMLNSAFNEFAGNPDIDLYPDDLAADIEAVNDVVYPGINDGVYRCWFSQRPGSEAAYKEGYDALQLALPWLEDRLQKSASGSLCGDHLTLADVRAFAHLFRFDGIYHDLMIAEPRGPRLGEKFPMIVFWLKEVFLLPEIAETCDLEVATRFYYPGDLPDEECDKIYAANRFEWMPTSEELEAKRQAEMLPKASSKKSANPQAL